MTLFSPADSLTNAQRARLEQYGELLKEWNSRINLVSRSDTDRIQSFHIQHSLMLGYRDFPEGATVVDWGTGGGLPALALAIRFPSTRFIAVDRVGKKVNAVRAMAHELSLDNVESVQCDALSYDGPCDLAVSRATAPAIDLVRWTVRAMKKNTSGQAISTPGGQKRYSDNSVKGPEAGNRGRARAQKDVSFEAGPAEIVIAASVEKAHTPPLPEPPAGLAISRSAWLPGLICLKGGDLDAEIRRARHRYPRVAVEKINIADITGVASWSSKYIVHMAEGIDEHP